MAAEDGSLVVGVVRESFPGEHRVALVPGSVPQLKKAGLQVFVEAGAGRDAGFRDEEYTAQGARIVAQPDEVFAQADILLHVRAAGANPQEGQKDFERLRREQVVIGMLDPLSVPQPVTDLAARGVTAFALELVPRITRAQSMDVLSSMATVAGYKAVLLAAAHLPRMFPMMMTAAGTITPARVLVIGAGVAGLQAISTARRLGGVVQGYDIRPTVKEQIQSLGAKFVELPLEAGQAEAAGGYARQMDEAFYRRQRELLGKVIKDSDVLITTAAVPGKKAPVLVTAEMVRAMAPGSVVVDVAAERGGNVELTRLDETVVEHGVTILGPGNLAATVPYHASQMYSRNITTFLLNLIKDRAPRINLDDEVISSTLLTRNGEVVHPHVRELLGIKPMVPEATVPELPKETT